MSLEISFTLSEKDLDYFRGVMTMAQSRAVQASEAELVEKANALLRKVDDDARAPHFVRERLVHLQSLISMLHDDDWPLADEERTDVISALAYFGYPADIIDDNVPVLGLLDDAIMIELVVREMRNEIDAYEAFCRYRSTQEPLQGRDISRDDWLQAKRRELTERLRERRERRLRSGRFTSFSFL